MNYNPYQRDPPEPHLSSLVTCVQCQTEMVQDEAVNIGSNEDPLWLCKHTDCLKHYATDVTAEYADFKHRSHQLVQQVTHGVGAEGVKDFGRFDVMASLPSEGDCLILRPNPDHGRFRVIQIEGE